MQNSTNPMTPSTTNFNSVHPVIDSCNRKRDKRSQHPQRSQERNSSSCHPVAADSSFFLDFIWLPVPKPADRAWWLRKRHISSAALRQVRKSSSYALWHPDLCQTQSFTGGDPLLRAVSASVERKQKKPKVVCVHLDRENASMGL